MELPIHVLVHYRFLEKWPVHLLIYRRNPQDFYPLPFFQRSVTDRNPMGSDDGIYLQKWPVQVLIFSYP